MHVFGYPIEKIVNEKGILKIVNYTYVRENKKVKSKCKIYEKIPDFIIIKWVITKAYLLII